MYSPLVTMESWGFTVISVRCATQSHSFAHELGHNLGAHHDRASAGTEQGCYSYSYGYQNPSLGYRTIMSYPCSTGSCARVNYFSNPDLNKDGLDGYPLGVPVGDPLEANNVQTFNLNGPIVAQYRASVVPLTTATATSSTSKTPFTTRTKTSSTSRTSNTITKTATKTSSTRTTRTLLPNEARGCSTPTTLPILDGIAVSNTVNTHAGSALISSVRAEIELKHTYMSDLVINLTRISDGMQVRLYQHSGCIDYADRGAILIFDDAASAVPQSNCAASSFKPLQPLSAFVGPKATDSWRLDIYDEWGGDNGVFYNWCLYLQTNGGTSTSSTSSTSTLTMKPKTFGDVSTVTPLTVTATTTKTLVVTQPPVTVSVTLPAVTSSVTRTLTATQVGSSRLISPNSGVSNSRYSFAADGNPAEMVYPICHELADDHDNFNLGIDRQRRNGHADSY